MQNEILSKTKIKINQEQKEFCERNLELSELEQGTDHLPLGKSPGLDGLPVEFYKKPWPIIKLDFFKWCKRFRIGRVEGVLTFWAFFSDILTYLKNTLT